MVDQATLNGQGHGEGQRRRAGFDTNSDGLGDDHKQRPIEPDATDSMTVVHEGGMLLPRGVDEDDDEGRGVSSRILAVLDPEIDQPCPQRPVYCTGCSSYRLAMSPMGILVAFLIGITWYSYVFITPEASWMELVLFHILLSLLIASYLQCMLLDPGTVPPGWHAAVSRSPLRARYAICRKSNQYKPPRSHFDSITQRLVLNMDHFCPWLVNCVGFYNRKFFVLFLFWTFVSALEFVLAMGIHGNFEIQGIMMDRTTGRLTVIKFMAFIIDAALALAVFGFLLFHIKMVLYNETTIEDDGSRFDMGFRKNIESVFGANPYLWLIPVYGDGPVGDGVHWPMPEGGDGAWYEMGEASNAAYDSDEGWA